MAVAGQAGTKGKTDGEPGANVEAHCCGMKGLGGATVEVLCHPEQIALGKEFTVNVRYRSDVPRPVDVHVDVLNAREKKFLAGKWAEMDDMQGDVSLTVKMSEQGSEPFLWKVGTQLINEFATCACWILWDGHWVHHMVSLSRRCSLLPVVSLSPICLLRLAS